MFVVHTENRDALQKYLSDNGVQTLIHYPIPPHKQSCCKAWNNCSYPITALHHEVLSLPISPVMTELEVRQVVDIVNKY